MKNLELIKFRIKYNDIELKNKIKIFIIFLVAIFLIPTFILFKPLTNLRNLLFTKSEIYIQAQDKKKSYLKKINNEENFDNTYDNDNLNSLNIPIAGTITSEYGMRTYPYYGMHTGIDISGIHHDNIRSIQDGIVTFAGSQNGYGYCVEIMHEDYYSFYAHLSQINVNVGDGVLKGQIIGIEGGDPNSDPNPGISTGHHLHFEIRTASGYGNSINPIDYIWK